MKKAIVCALASMVFVLSLAGCGNSTGADKTDKSEEAAEAVTEEDGFADAELVETEPRFPVEKADISQMKIDYKSSELYTKEDMDAAIKVILDEFGTWDGCVLYDITYTDDQTCKDGIEYIDELGMDVKYDDCIVFTSSFHSPVEGGGAWEPDYDYEGWQWYLGRVKGGDWELLTWGY